MLLLSHKQAVKGTTRKEKGDKKLIMSMFVEDYSVKQLTEHFECSKYQVHQAKLHAQVTLNILSAPRTLVSGYCMMVTQCHLHISSVL